MAVVCTGTALSGVSGKLSEQLSRKQLLAAIVYLLCTINGMTCTPSTLSALSKCIYDCMNEKQLLAAAAALLCQINNGGGGGTGVFLQGVAYTGTDPTSDGVKPPNLLGQAVAIKPGATVYVWDITNQVWT